MDEIRKMGYDITWVAELDRYMNDVSVFQEAQRENRILLTNDKDFGELVFRQRMVTTGIILFRTKGQQVKEKKKLLKRLFESHNEKISGHFVVVSDEKFRFIPV